MSNSSALKMTNFSKAFVAWWVVLWAIWHGQPIRIISSFLSLAFVIKEWCLPILTDVLSTPREIHLCYRIPVLAKALSIAANIPSGSEDDDKWVSKSWFTTMCWLMLNNLTVTGFIFLSPWSLLSSVLIL